MKKIVCLMLASVSLGVTFQASAQTRELTRAQVEQQLVQAQAQGLLPSNGVHYPPNARTVARNHATYAAQHDAHVTASPTNSGYGGVTDGHGSE
ncbi:DUF4148 domain-containing protein [Caballeronia sp. ATUFL_M2_KS44]|uniref:DUF4148 domain-containing protein n=1 Tax=Caballeronia sp. ATUFL_M2_KS44 TaxID=2921767 RepID=UPI0020293CF0|nr:DUF4148 domain-containing protein [Caballeronia sp. ATUFL_M2_KS44]